MRRYAAVLGAFLAFTLGGLVFFYPSASADTGGLCSICTPNGVVLEAELAGTPLAPGELAAFDQIAAGYHASSGATVATGAATASASADAAGLGLGSTLGAAALIATGVPLLAGGVANWFVKVPDDVSHLPAGSGASTPAYDAGVRAGGSPWTGDLPDITLTRTPGTDSWVVSGMDTHGLASTRDPACLLSGGAGASTAAVATSYYTGGSMVISGPGGYVADGYSITCPGTLFVVFTRTSAPYRVAWHSGQPAASAVPPRWVEQTVTCKRSDGTTHTVTMSGTASELTPGALVSVLGLLCPSGERAVDWSSKLKTTGGADLPLGGRTHPDSSSVPDACLGAATCQLRLQYLTDSGWQTCTVGSVGPCTNWWTSPTRTKDFRCQYGTGSSWSVVSVNSCTPLRRAYQEDPTASPFDPVPDPAPTDSFCSFGLSDFLTGLVVFKAVGCALVWAFVPTEGLTPLTQPVGDAFSGSVLGDVNGAADAWFRPVVAPLAAAPTSCDGPSLTVDNPMPGAGRPPRLIDNLHPWSACGPVASRISDVWISIASFVTLFSALYIGTNSILRSVGSGVDFADGAQSFDRAESSRKPGKS